MSPKFSACVLFKPWLWQLQLTLTPPPFTWRMFAFAVTLWGHCHHRCPVMLICWRIVVMAGTWPPEREVCVCMCDGSLGYRGRIALCKYFTCSKLAVQTSLQLLLFTPQHMLDCTCVRFMLRAWLLGHHYHRDCDVCHDGLDLGNGSQDVS